MLVLLAAGGTAGHINPALSIAEGLLQKYPNCEIHFAGRKSGMEYGLVTKAGYPFHHIEVRGIQRSLTPKNICRNIAALWHLLFAPAKAGKIIKQIKPDLVIGAGGYVSGPVVRTAAKKGIKTAIHEQNAFPGVTNKILAKYANVIFAPNQSALERLAHPEKTIVSGNPVNPAMFKQNRQQARQKLEAAEKTLIISYGGSLGAMRINQLMAELAFKNKNNKNILHIHATGAIEKEDFAELAKQKGIADSPNFIIREYIDNMPELMSAADLIVCRAGAATLAEIAAVGRAAVLIPSPNVAENHQYYNALEFEKAGAAKVFEENRLDVTAFIEEVGALCANRQKLEEMGREATKLAQPHALQIIIDALAKLLENA